MSSLTFLFSAGLWALPLAALPVFLHLLFRQKNVVIPFSTLRFVRASAGRFAARRKVQRWLLLACRSALLLGLIWAIAQPAMRAAPAAGASGAAATAVVIVVDTSYSMQLQDGATTLLARADHAVAEMLAGRFRGARAAVLRSAPIANDRPELEELRRQERFRDASEIRWSPLRAQPSPRSLADRVGDAAAMLAAEKSPEKWLVVVSDFQRREFPRPIAALKDVRLALIDLQPPEPRNVAVSGVSIQPAQPIPGLDNEAVVDLMGRPGDLRQVNLATARLRGEENAALPPQPVRLDDSGHGQARFPIRLGAGGFQRLDASLAEAQPLAWGQTRTLVLQTSPRREVIVLPAPPFESATQRLRWALDPNDGHEPTWPLAVRAADTISPTSDVVVMLLSDWPDLARAQQLLAFVKSGRTLIWFVRPGLEKTWEALPAMQKSALAELLPGRPAGGVAPERPAVASIVSPADPALNGLTDERFQIGEMTVRRLVPFEALDPLATPLLAAAPASNPAGGSRGWVYRRPVGAGTVFTSATLPDKRFSTMQLHPIFPPMLVQMASQTAGNASVQNVEIGSPLVVSGPNFDRWTELRIQRPQGEVDRVLPTKAPDGRRQFVYAGADEPGVYAWRGPGNDDILAASAVQLPAAEADLKYAPAASVFSDLSGVVLARSAGEWQTKVATLDQPRPLWAVPLGIVLVLLCAESLLGSRR